MTDKIQVKRDKHGKRYVRYKKKKYYVHKTVRENISQKSLMKWLMTHVDKLTKQRKPRRRQPNKTGAPGMTRGAVELHRKTAENKKPEDAKATTAYINAVRAQENLPPLPSGQPIINIDRTPKTSKDSKALVKKGDVEPAQPTGVALGDPGEHGSVAEFAKHKQKQAKEAKEEAKRQTSKAKKIEEDLYKTMRASVITDLRMNKYKSADALKTKATALNIPTMHETTFKKKGKLTKNIVAKKKEDLFADLLKDPEFQKEIDELTKKLIDPTPAEKPEKDAPEHKADEHEEASKAVLGSGVEDKGLSNFEIDKYMKGHPGYLGCIASDEIESHIVPKVKPGVKGSFVMNLDKHDKPGTHWVSCYFTPESIEYYNSFGDPPTQSFRDGAKAIANKLNPDGFFKLKVNHIQRQDDRTKTCGYHAMKFIKDRDSGKSFAESTGYSDHKKDDSVRGEKAVTKFIDHMDGGGFEFITGH